MKTQYIRLFLAGAVGAAIGGKIVHNLLHLSGFLAFGTYLGAIMLGALVATSIIDPKGTLDVIKKASAIAFHDMKLLPRAIGMALKCLFIPILKIGIWAGVAAISEIGRASCRERV